MPFKRNHSHSDLKNCDHPLAAEALKIYFADHHHAPALHTALNAFYANPSPRTARPLVDANPALLLIFRECLPGGIFDRHRVAPAPIPSLKATALAAAIWDSLPKPAPTPPAPLTPPPTLTPTADPASAHF